MGTEENNRKTIAEKRGYSVKTVEDAKKIGLIWLKETDLENVIKFGLPEIDDRYNFWRIPLISTDLISLIGEIVIDAYSTLIIQEKTTSKEILEKRLLKRDDSVKSSIKIKNYIISSLRDTIALGDSEEVLKDFPAQSIDLIFTSPPYYNARPEYSDFVNYEDYLNKIKRIIHECTRVLNEGRFFVMNVAPILIKRIDRTHDSKRIAVPFDMHRLFIEEGYEFIDDINWVKPEGAGWATGRGRRFAADRSPLQYKTVPVTEYVLVYRKKTDKLIDWFIRNYPDKNIVQDSKIADNYEKTNIWKINPRYDQRHPATFPLELAEKVIQYYSFKNDVVLDPFAGIGTVGEAAIKNDRRFVLIEINKDYIEIIRNEITSWFSNYRKKIRKINYINCKKPKKLLDYIQ